MIDARILGPLEKLLREYVFTVTMTLPAPVEGLSENQNELRWLIQLESIHVRGEAFQSQLEGLATELYSPHEEWCLANLSFTVQDAFAIANAIAGRNGDKMHSLREAQGEILSRVQADPAVAMTLDLPPNIRDDLANGLPDSSLEEFAKSIGMIWFFSKAPEIVGFTLEELQERIVAEIAPERVIAFLDFASVRTEDIRGDPDLLALSPTAKTPLIRHGDRFYMFVPGLLFEAIYYAFHTRLFRGRSLPSPHTTESVPIGLSAPPWTRSERCSRTPRRGGGLPTARSGTGSMWMA